MMIIGTQSMSQKVIKKLFQYLEKENNPNLVTSIESIVTLLRNKKSGPVDCQLYLKNYESFIFKLKNADLGVVDDKILLIYSDTLPGCKDAFHDPENENFRECNPFIDIFNYASTQHAAVAYAQKIKQGTDKIKKLE